MHVCHINIIHQHQYTLVYYIKATHLFDPEICGIRHPTECMITKTRPKLYRLQRLYYIAYNVINISIHSPYQA